ncbi:MAG: hypothetical protein ACTMKW_01655, partial [Brevibacterium aurantiacum]
QPRSTTDATISIGIARLGGGTPGSAHPPIVVTDTGFNVVPREYPTGLPAEYRGPGATQRI